MKIPMWSYKDKIPSEIYDFTPQFRQVLGWKDKSHTSQTWSCQRLMLTQEAIDSFLSNSKLVTIQSDTCVAYEVEFEAVDLLVYPLGSAILVFHVNWMTSRSKDVKLSLDDIRTLIFASKYRHKVKQLCLGWNFYNPFSEIGEDILPESHTNDLGHEMHLAKYRVDQTISLCQLGKWLLHTEGANQLETPMRLLDHTRHAYHHSAIVINKAPPNDVLQEYLYHLRHAFGQKNRPPPNPEHGLGPVLVSRLNRYIGISREGSVCISWPTNLGDPTDFELTKWHKKFQGVYLLLSLHAHGERSVLYELSDLAASQAEALKIVTSDINFQEMKQSRQKLRELAAIMARYTLSMSSDDCGGSSEYAEFFTTLRNVFGIKLLRDELSQELKDVLAVVEANYMEEERRQRDEAESARRKNREMQTTLRQQRDRQEQQFSMLISIIGAFTLPFVLMSGIFGMNLVDLPHVSFGPLLMITLAVSFVLFGLLLFFRFKIQRKNLLYEERRKFSP